MPREYSKPYKQTGPQVRTHYTLRNGLNGYAGTDAGLGYPTAPKREQAVVRRSTCHTHGLPLPCQFCERWWQDENALAERGEWEGA